MAKKLRMRKCLVTKEVYSASELIRFVCAPDGQITPDVAAKLPGRGCWILAKRDVLEEAVKKKVFLRFGHQVIASSKKNDLDELDEKCGKRKKCHKG